jgi:hypothetical protein
MALCTITGVIQNLDESPAAEAQVRATIQSTEADQSGQVVGDAGVVSEPVVAFTDVNGQFSIALKQGAAVLFEIPTINLRRFVTIPNVAGPVGFETLI